MKVRNPGKTLDCVRMKRRIQERMAADTRGMNADEILEYYRNRIASSRFAPFLKLEAKPTSDRRCAAGASQHRK